MKKYFLILLVTLAFSVAPVMGDVNTYFNKGDLVAQVGVSFGWGVGVEGGAEYSLGQWTPIPVLPLDYGVGASVGLNTGALGYGFGVGAAAYGTLHYSWKNLKTKIAFVDQLETTAGIGLNFNTYTGLWVASVGSLVYHLDNRLGIALGYYSVTGSTIGVTYKL